MYYIYRNRNTEPKGRRKKKMIEVKGLEIISEIVEQNERVEKAEREIRKQRIKELIAQGIDKMVAEVMVDTFTEYEVFGY